MQYLVGMSNRHSGDSDTEKVGPGRYAPRVAKSKNEGAAGAKDGSASDFEPEIPNVGEIIQRLRVGRGMSLQDTANVTGLSPSFLSAVERGKSDIALKRLARLAHAFGHDVGSLLGYTARRAKPLFLGNSQRVRINRGKGIDYEVIRLPGIDFELIAASFAPGAAFHDELSHEGVDIAYVTSGELTLIYNGADYPIPEGMCALYSGGYAHSFRNDTKKPASMLGVVTETVY